MNSHCSINRKGKINLKGNRSDHQCAKSGHEVYYYELKVLFVENIKLDKNGFIIEHQNFDDMIQDIQAGSCEIMSREILNEVEKLLTKKELQYIGAKLQIRPAFVAPDDSAYFQEIRCDNRTDLQVILAL